MDKIIYMDNAAATFVEKRVFDAMVPYLSTDCYNPSSIYDGAQNVHKDIDIAREVIAKTINANLEVYCNYWFLNINISILISSILLIKVSISLIFPSLTSCFKLIFEEKSISHLSI